MDEQKNKKLNDWKRTVSGFLGKDFWNEFQGFFARDWPLVNLYENDDHVLCLIALPGIRRMDDVRITINHTSLEIKGHLHRPFADYRAVHEEIQEGPFERHVDLPAPVQNEPVEAVFKTGMLILTLRRIPHFEVSEIVIADEE